MSDEAAIFDQEQFELLFEKDNDELLRLLGKEVTSNRVGVRPLTPREYVAKAKAWLIGFKERVRCRICSDDFVLKYLKAPENSRRVDIASAVFDIVSVASGAPVPALSLIHI